MTNVLLALITILLLGLVSLKTQESLDRMFPGSDNPALKIFFIYLIIVLVIGAGLWWVFSYFGVA